MPGILPHRFCFDPFRVGSGHRRFAKLSSGLPLSRKVENQWSRRKDNMGTKGMLKAHFHVSEFSWLDCYFALALIGDIEGSPLQVPIMCTALTETEYGN